MRRTGPRSPPPPLAQVTPKRPEFLRSAVRYPDCDGGAEINRSNVWHANCCGQNCWSGSSGMAVRHVWSVEWRLPGRLDRNQA